MTPSTLLRRLILSCLLLLMLIAPVSISSQSNGDVLIYSLEAGEQTIFNVYDPVSNTSAPLIKIDAPYSASSVGSHGVLAVSWQDNGDIYLVPIDALEHSLTNITYTPDADEFPAAWSPDGHYLAYTSYRADDDIRLYVWDGDTTLDVTPTDFDALIVSYEDVGWDAAGRLVFTVFAPFNQRQPSSNASEIYLWDGNTTVNVSQNPTGEDRFAAWSADGRLAFLSARGANYDIWVWDGVSYRNGFPDATTYTNVEPELTDYFSGPGWTSDGRVAFLASPGRHAQVYVWDGQTATDMSQNPDLHNGGAVWNADGRWAFVTFFSPEQLLYVRDSNNETLLVTDGQYAPAWSAAESLAFCDYQRPDWTLKVWNGSEVIPVAEGNLIYAQWQQTGNSVVCWSG
ncbi:MAG: PD40 domain-containing protein [Chloroflexi bacterium]|nr:PD40 domain-containing protein [Chloroflexota bacterium]